MKSLTISAAVFMLIGFSACRPNAESETATAGNSAGSCADAMPKIFALAKAANDFCASDSVEGARNAAAGVSAVITLIGSKAHPALAGALAAQLSACKTAEAVQASVELARDTCSANQARDNYIRVGVESCSRLNAIPPAQRRTALPSWCPDKRTGQFYCGPAERGIRTIPCMNFDGGQRRAIGAVYEFSGAASTSMTFQGIPNNYRATSLAGQRCFVPAASVRCSN